MPLNKMPFYLFVLNLTKLVERKEIALQNEME
jgi:hypothetical protein